MERTIKKFTWLVLAITAITVFLTRGLFAPIAYQISVTGQQNAHAPAIFPMLGIPVVFGVMLYIIDRFEKDPERAKIGVILGSIIVLMCHVYLGILAITET